VTGYADFLARKAQLANAGGFPPDHLPPHLYPFQEALTDWAVRQGRGALFADCGMGKTPMALAWAEQVHRATGRPVLFLTPLAVGFQIVAEAGKFGHDAALSRTGKVTAPVTVTNYEQLPKFDPADFAGVVCDESSILKSFDGVTRAQVTEFMRRLPYRLLCTATAAPNDWIELGTSSEALGGLGHMDMLTRFFTNKNRSTSSRGDRRMIGGEKDPWRLKGHAEEPFWRWVASWARAIRKPSDYGYDDGRFRLPPLEVTEHVVEASRPADGTLFDVPAVGLREEREENRRTLVERCEAAAKLLTDADAAVAWCHLNDESRLLADSSTARWRCRRRQHRRQGSQAGRVQPRRDPGPGHQTVDRRVGPELAARAPHDLLPVPLLRAVVSGGAPHVAVRADPTGPRRRDHHRGRGATSSPTCNAKPTRRTKCSPPSSRT
jgi:hypothetical protein